jgi:hypothetical protein
MLYLENCVTPFTDRNLWLQSILDAQPVPGSALNDLEVRRMMTETAVGRRIFNHALHYTYASIAVPLLAKEFNIGEGDAREGDAEDKADDSQCTTVV